MENFEQVINHIARYNQEKNGCLLWNGQTHCECEQWGVGFWNVDEKNERQ